MSAAPAKAGPPAPAKRVALQKLGKPEAMGGNALVNWYKPGEELPALLFEARDGRPAEATGWREGVHYKTVAAG